MELSKDVSEFILLLNKNDVKYLVVGGWAIGLHGIPRYTKDIDLFINKTKKNAEKILLALDEFGFGSLGITIEDLTKDDFVIQLGNEPNRIDILTDIAAVTFDEAWCNRLVVKNNGLELPFISIEDLVNNKSKAGRPQDLADVAALKKIKNQT
jgi:predicted nucleotidyltransferase